MPTFAVNPMSALGKSRRDSIQQVLIGPREVREPRVSHLTAGEKGCGL